MCVWLRQNRETHRTMHRTYTRRAWMTPMERRGRFQPCQRVGSCWFRSARRPHDPGTKCRDPLPRICPCRTHTPMGSCGPHPACGLTPRGTRHASQRQPPRHRQRKDYGHPRLEFTQNERGETLSLDSPRARTHRKRVALSPPSLQAYKHIQALTMCMGREAMGHAGPRHSGMSTNAGADAAARREF